MAEGIVLELQRDCLNQSVHVSDILRKARAVASKLGLNELNEWIGHELEGYKVRLDDLPAYRKARGAPKFWNPYNGYCPIMAGNGWFGDAISTVYLSQGIAELEALASSTKGSQLIYQYPPLIQEELQKQMSIPMECSLHFSTTQVKGALDYVRNKILDWTLELERQGIQGENFSFNNSEKSQVQTAMNNFYNANIGVFGDVAGNAKAANFSNSQGGIDDKALREFLSQASEATPGLPFSIRKKAEAQLQEIEKLANEGDSPTLIQKAMSSLKATLEGASGNLVASALLAAMS